MQSLFIHWQSIPKKHYSITCRRPLVASLILEVNPKNIGGTRTKSDSLRLFVSRKNSAKVLRDYNPQMEFQNNHEDEP